MTNIGDYLALSDTSPTGLVWIRSPAKRVHVGDAAFTNLNTKGYYQGQFKGKQLLAHRIVHYLHTGRNPVMVDHIDGNRQNNTPANLREITAAGNSHNRIAKGFSYESRYSKWRAYIRVDGKLIHLGYYATARDARGAYLQAKRLHHPVASPHCFKEYDIA